MRTAITLSDNHQGHAVPNHVERPERLQAIQQLIKDDPVLDSLIVLPPSNASIEDVVLVHPREYYDRLAAAVQAGGARLDPDTYATPDSLNVAMQALGGLLSITDRVMRQKVDNGFAVVRPPGHHARPDTAMGFCLLANISIAAEWAKKHHGVKKILIVDFDVHHGNGTQEIFYEDPDVMYMSTHQWPLYPGTGRLEETGAGNGQGTTINVPLPAHTGDDDFLRVFEQILTPIALKFNPELILVSAGYDAHWMDPIGGLNISVAGFTAVFQEILSWARQCSNNRLVTLLEGGYHADALAHSVLSTLRLLQDPDAHPSDPFGKSPSPDADVKDELKRLIEFHT
ncbi:MAG: histone deacetylase [Rhodothermales bacterium]